MTEKHVYIVLDTKTKLESFFSRLVAVFFFQVKGAVLDLKLLRGHQGSGAAVPSDDISGVPLCSFVNIRLCGTSKPCQGTVLLENPRGTSNMTLDQLKRQVLDH